MNRKKLFIFLVILTFFIFLADALANKFYWYYSVWYFDMPMHFFGGFLSGLIFIFILSSKSFSHKSPTAFILKVLLGVLLIGISWEVFEFSANTYFVKNLFLVNKLDSISDIFFDLAGGIGATLYYLKRIVFNYQNSVQLQ